VGKFIPKDMGSRRITGMRAGAWIDRVTNGPTPEERVS